MKFFAKYRCRLCGQVFDHNECKADKDSLMNKLKIAPQFNKVDFPSTSLVYDPNKFGQELISTHLCEDGSVGLADLAGFSVTEWEA